MVKKWQVTTELMNLEAVSEPIEPEAGTLGNILVTSMTSLSKNKKRTMNG